MNKWELCVCVCEGKGREEKGGEESGILFVRSFVIRLIN